MPADHCTVPEPKTATSTPGTVINFAYGSNMLTSRIRARVPSARPLGVATLQSHQLRWHKSSKDGSGKCDVIAGVSPETVVYGVLYEIAQAEKHKLDTAEGLGNGYAERRVELQCDGKPVLATLYYATNIDANLQPYSWYRHLVIAGARQHGLPDDYVKALEAALAIEDPDRTRHGREMALADSK